MAPDTNASIFLHSPEQPLRIFVESTELIFRPRLIRDLRSRGAIIAHYPPDAQVIIVDPESDSGKQYVADWSFEPGKVVLHHDWVTKSIAEGRALLGQDDWGGMRLLATSNGHDAIMHPLPTPPPDHSGHPLPPANPGNAQLPMGEPIAGPVPSPVNNVPALSQNIRIDPAALAVAAQLIQQMGPAGLQTMLQQAATAHPPPTVAPAAGPSNHLAAYDGPKVVASEVAATDFMLTPSSSSNTPRRSRSTPDPPSSIPAKRRKSLGDKPISSASARSKGKGRADFADMPEPPAKHRRRSSSPEEEDYASSSAEEEHSGSPREPDEIFIHDDGSAIAFWVQMETKQRGDLVHMIKKNKGRVVSDIAEADIAVLAQDSAKNYEHWNKITAQNKKVVVQSRYIRQCVNECALLEPDEFGVVLTSKVGGSHKRGRPLGSTTTSRSRKPVIPITPPSPRAFRISVSPPPPKRVENWQIGKFLFTSEEIEYIRRYIPILYTRDPDASINYICEKLHEKMAHHSLASWRSWISRQPRHKFLLQCKDMASQYRSGNLAKHHSHETASPHRRREKAHGTPQRPATSEHNSPPVSVKKPIPAEAMQVEEDQVASQAESDDARDFDVITSFLAEGGADNRSDAEVWVILAQEHPTRTAAEWQEFWLEKGVEIDDEVRRQMGESDTPSAQAA